MSDQQSQHKVNGQTSALRTGFYIPGLNIFMYTDSLSSLAPEQL